MNALVVGVLGLGVVAAVFTVYLGARCYCRIYAVEHASPSIWTVARPVGIVVGAAVWVVIRLVTPDVTESAVLTVETVAFSAVFSLVCLGVGDVIFTWLFVDEPTYGHSREVFIQHEAGTFEEQDDWIDALYGEEQL